MFRRCKICKREKPVEEFALQTSTGRTYRGSYCSDCNRRSTFPAVRRQKNLKLAREMQRKLKEELG